MSSDPITGVYNDAYIAEVFEAYHRDPASVDASWRQFFRVAESIGGSGVPMATSAPASAPQAAPTADRSILRKVAGAAALAHAIRQYGHLDVQLDPLGTPPVGAMELSPIFHRITEPDLTEVPASALGLPGETAAEGTSWLRGIYSSRIALEVGHIEEEDEREWFRQVMEHDGLALSMGDEAKRTMLERLTEVDGLERFMGRAWVNMKRFSLEGTDTMVPMLDTAIDEASKIGTREVVIGMAHRGRINTLAHILDKPYAKIFNEFDGKYANHAHSDTGDVKYHLGGQTDRHFPDGRSVALKLLPNPSHLEVINPLLMGVARARVVTLGGNETSVLSIAIHGDAAFPGEGIVAETLNMSKLPGYRIGGTLHIIVNNQVGFTTNPSDSRSTYYASDLAKGFDIPIVHVNADDPEACVAAVRLGIMYRAAYGKDFLIDLVGYRRWGHNEGDEPTYTQPALYARVRQHPTVRQVWATRLIADGVVTADQVEAMDKAQQDRCDAILAESRRDVALDMPEFETLRPTPSAMPAVVTAVRAESLIALNERLLTWPAEFTPHPRLAKQLERRREALGEGGGIDWGHAEALAFASLVAEGIDVRLSGQDAERGTFTHRHAVLNDVTNGAKYTPLQHIPNATGRLEIHNSPLNEMGVLGFEYGYATVSPDALVLWEAQFGDFVNMAQPIIDQFIAADRAKWGQDSGLTLLLPHGYEGQGPEHSSARLERFLQLCAEGNLRIAYPSTSAQYFHVLRRQAKLPIRRPLVLMQPKSMLRLSAAASRLEDLASGRFMQVLDDPNVVNREEVTRLVFCTGKLYYDLVGGGHPAHLAVVRVEQLYPWPHEDVSRLVDLYPNIAEIVWAQEEPKNMGAWSYVAPRLRASAGNALIIRYIGRPERSSPAEGHASSHAGEQARIVSDVHAEPIVPRRAVLR
ncbi:MAG: 2-oxoglutarate dehydrogenase E1 component [Gemmatimonadota bacterium]